MTCVWLSTGSVYSFPHLDFGGGNLVTILLCCAVSTTLPSNIAGIVRNTGCERTRGLRTRRPQHGKRRRSLGRQGALPTASFGLLCVNVLLSLEHHRNNILHDKARFMTMTSFPIARAHTTIGIIAVTATGRGNLVIFMHVCLAYQVGAFSVDTFVRTYNNHRGKQAALTY